MCWTSGRRVFLRAPLWPVGLRLVAFLVCWASAFSSSSRPYFPHHPRQCTQRDAFTSSRGPNLASDRSSLPVNWRALEQAAKLNVRKGLCPQIASRAGVNVTSHHTRDMG